MHHSLTCIIHLKLALVMQMLTSNRRLKLDQLGLIIYNRCFIWDLNAFALTERVNLVHSEFLGAIWGVFFESSVYIPTLPCTAVMYRCVQIQLNMPTNGITKFMSMYLISKIFTKLQMYTIIVYIYLCIFQPNKLIQFFIVPTHSPDFSLTAQKIHHHLLNWAKYYWATSIVL